jgi:hypothetical protein
MNPWYWKRRHLMTWAILIAAGAVAGMIFAWFLSPFSRAHGGDTPTMFFAWLHYPVTYWPYVVAGAVMAGLAYYSADLLTGAR